jgi:chorismate mutase
MYSEDNTLSNKRLEIDKINMNILEAMRDNNKARMAVLLKERNQIAREMGLYKLKNKICIKDIQREEKMMEDILTEAKKMGLDLTKVGKIFREAITQATQIQIDLFKERQ